MRHAVAVSIGLHIWLWISKFSQYTEKQRDVERKENKRKRRSKREKGRNGIQECFGFFGRAMDAFDACFVQFSRIYMLIDLWIFIGFVVKTFHACIVLLRILVVVRQSTHDENETTTSTTIFFNNLFRSLIRLFCLNHDIVEIMCKFHREIRVECAIVHSCVTFATVGVFYQLTKYV